MIYVEPLFDGVDWHLWIHVGGLSFETLLPGASEQDAKRIAQEVAKAMSTTVARLKEK